MLLFTLVLVYIIIIIIANEISIGVGHKFNCMSLQMPNFAQICPLSLLKQLYLVNDAAYFTFLGFLFFNKGTLALVRVVLECCRSNRIPIPSDRSDFINQ